MPIILVTFQEQSDFKSAVELMMEHNFLNSPSNELHFKDLNIKKSVSDANSAAVMLENLVDYKPSSDEDSFYLCRSRYEDGNPSLCTFSSSLEEDIPEIGLALIIKGNLQSAVEITAWLDEIVAVWRTKHDLQANTYLTLSEFQSKKDRNKLLIELDFVLVPTSTTGDICAFSKQEKVLH